MTMAQAQRRPGLVEDLTGVAGALTTVQTARGLPEVILPPEAKAPFKGMLGMDSTNLAKIGTSLVGPLLLTASVGNVLGRMIGLL